MQQILPYSVENRRFRNRIVKWWTHGLFLLVRPGQWDKFSHPHRGQSPASVSRSKDITWPDKSRPTWSPHNESLQPQAPLLWSSVQFSCSVVSDSLWPHEPQHDRPPCPSPTPGVHPNQCPSSQWCHPTISSCVIPFSSCPQSFPASSSGFPEKVTEKGAHSSPFCGPTDTSDKISPPASHRSSSPPPPPHPPTPVRKRGETRAVFPTTARPSGGMWKFLMETQGAS